MFSHDRLKVYAKSLDFAGSVALALSELDRKHAFVDQLVRAAESIVVNLAEGARLSPGSAKLRSLDFSLGSTLECAACLDVARVKGVLAVTDCDRDKQVLCEIASMLIGLRKAWYQSAAHEDPVPYTSNSPFGRAQRQFHHETLDVYQAALSFVTWFASIPVGAELVTRLSRQVDQAATSIALNIAEGNGRYAELEHKRFLDIAACSAVKAAAYLDLSERRSIFTRSQVITGKKILERIKAMLSSMCL